MKYIYPILFGLLVLFFGVYISGTFLWYYKFPHIDKLYHFLGGVAVGWFVYYFFSIDQLSLPRYKQVLLLIAATCLVAVFWEYAERLSTLYSPRWLYHWFNGGDLNDTLLDVLFGMMGSFIFWILAQVRIKFAR